MLDLGPLDRARLCGRWLEAWQRAPGRLGGRIQAGDLAALSESVLDELALAGSGADVVPGAPALREVEKRVAFVGGWMAGEGARAADAVAWVHTLRDTLLEAGQGGAREAAFRGFTDWLVTVVVEGYAESRADALRLSHRDMLERGTPVVLVTPDLPAVLFVGDPDREVLESVLGRLLLFVVRAGARLVLLDATGHVDPRHKVLVDGLAGLCRHPRMRTVTLIACGLTTEAEELWKSRFPEGTSLVVVERLVDAVAEGLARLRSGRSGQKDGARDP